jgi:hypothetical protein
MFLKVDIGSFCSIEDYVAEVKKHMYHTKENHFGYKLQHLAPCFPVNIELILERSTSCNLGFSR